MRRRFAARVAPIAALVMLLAGVVLCPTRCLAGDGSTQTAPPPCHHDAGGTDGAGALPPAAHASCCAAALQAPATTPSALAPVLAVLPAPPLGSLRAAAAPSLGDPVRSGARGAPPGPLYLRLRTLLV
ncbi:MAG: hypothetical protein KIT14_09480 [bacterium]|nr:hypothetical protein [bacterium]